MKIVNAEIKIKQPRVPDTEYFETELIRLGYDVIRWAVVKIEDGICTLNVSFKLS